MGFDDFKKGSMIKYERAKKEGLVDKDILKELDIFNKLNDYYTTSSCSGRILLLKTPDDNKKMPDAFYFKAHGKVKPAEIIRRVRGYSDSYELWFKSEPFILHIGCRTIENARRLLSLCKELGIKRAGINAWGRRIIVEVLGTQYVETLVVKSNKILVSDDYLSVLAGKSNLRLSQAKKVLHSFFKASKSLKA